MRKLVIAAAAAVTIAFGGAFAWHASAAAPAGAVPQAGRYTPIHPAACGAPGPHCGPRSHWVCGPEGRRCWCARC
jgi:hypothetical protein